MTRPLLALVYHLVVVPIAAVVRLGRDPLDRAWDPDRPTYLIVAGDEGRWGSRVAGRRPQ